MKTSNGCLYLFFLFLCKTSYSIDNQINHNAPFVLELSQGSHPRLLLTDRKLLDLQLQALEEPRLKKYVSDVLETASKALTVPALDYSLMHDNSYAITKACLSRIYLMAFTFRWTGDERFAIKARDEMLGACSLTDWNPTHFSDVSEMTHAIAIGYDWLFNWLDSASRISIRAGIMRNGLEPGRLAYMDPSSNNGWWVKNDGKWNLVCNSGLIIGCLALFETDPEYGRIIIPSACSSLPRAILKLGTSGGGTEGYTSWSTSLFQFASGLSAMQSSIGNMANLDKVEDLTAAGLFTIVTAGPTELMLCYGDQGERLRRTASPELFWLAATYHQPVFSENEHLFLKTHRATIGHILWYQSSENINPFPSKRSFLLNRQMQFFTMRSSWSDPNAWFVGVKAGINKSGSGHYDLGNFELDACGVRWFRDLGADNIENPDYFKNTNPENRLAYYRVSSSSHNIPQINFGNQEMSATARFIRSKTDTVCPYGIIDLTEAYCNSVQNLFRGVKLVGSKGVLIQDEVMPLDSCVISWGITTDALITIQKNRIAILKLKGKILYAHLILPTSAVFHVKSAIHLPPQKENTGVSRLEIELPRSNRSQTFIVLFTSDMNSDILSAPVTGLLQWK